MQNKSCYLVIRPCN